MPSRQCKKPTLVRGQGRKRRLITQSPVTSPQSPVPSPQSPITSHQSPVTNHQFPLFLRKAKIVN
ncbi:hypothetical protein H6F47_22750 [Sphaerospermopsis sp. FACHB-1094]|uniref:hypothetical protein n=1 Tax=Sphaerospermopsis sp. FACHB-1094 TaxID=2692861 RepID=UPI001685A02A|nr:hypothetical protein [Sphaerospermopsis sp. FACHB-1094]MBD2135158.1 hypothetical protein [Sphaerospermopsis sp. FACHB-1094]